MTSSKAEVERGVSRLFCGAANGEQAGKEHQRRSWLYGMRLGGSKSRSALAKRSGQGSGKQSQDGFRKEATVKFEASTESSKLFGVLELAYLCHSADGELRLGR